MSYQPGDLLLNKYRIDSLVGSGAFAEVFLATHLELNAPRALKILRRDAPGLGSSEYSDFRQRFQLEARLGARIDHPNLVRVYDFERDGETLILVMEFCPGGSLADLLSRLRQGDERLPLETVLRTAIDLASGLSALHALDAVHRDLKPSNVLFTSQGGAKLADLGLAQIPGGPSLRSQLSTAAPHPGTPGYMSPEQTNITNYLSSASDIYALGCVLFEMLTGRVYVSQRPGTLPGRLRPDTPAWLDELVGRMLSRDPEARPWDGAEAAQLLQQDRERVRQEEAQRLAAEQKAKETEAAQCQAQEQTQLAARHLQEYRVALEGENWQVAEDVLTALAGLGAEEDEEATSLRQELNQAQEKARQRRAAQEEAERADELRCKAEERARLAAQLHINYQVALKGERWRAAKNALKALAALGEDEAEETALLRQELQQTQEQAKRMAEAKRQAEERARRELTIELAPGVTMEFVRVPAGEFLMGSDTKKDPDARPDELPQHKVYLDEYLIGKTPVTNLQYQAFIQASSRTPPAHWIEGIIPEEKEQHPIVNVNWQDAVAFCQMASQVTGKPVRLPSEAEWEKAARGTDGRLYPWGNKARVRAWEYLSRDYSPVGKYSPLGDSPYGCVDMIGNVWEWIADWYAVDYYRKSPASNPPGPASGNSRVLRGCSFRLPPWSVRTSYRINYDPAYVGDNVGFRCACSV